ENKGGKAHLIPNGVQEDFFQPFKSEKDPRSILFVGRLSKNKRVDNLIRAFAHAYQREPRARLHIVGADWEGLMPELKEIAKEEGVEDFVWFHGKMVDENLLALYRKSGIFASASEYEGIGISTIEAMASGCIPVLNKIPPFENFSASCKEVKLTNFDYPDEAGKLLYDMMNISSDELKKKRMRCRDFACGFGWNTIIEKQIHFYRSLII
ncbi:MAG: glycosyltransferase family 4 protein, partial [archaeon]|nr:glycosyltransferase family 4 protein [archaeon]